MSGKTIISSSLEDYLEAIYHITAKKIAARPKDISTHLNVKQSSVTEALNLLKKEDLINYNPYDVITLTAKGKVKAKEIIKKHNVLFDFFSNILKVTAAEADNSACKIEHLISQSILNKLTTLNDFLKKCPLSDSLEINTDKCNDCNVNCFKKTMI